MAALINILIGNFLTLDTFVATLVRYSQLVTTFLAT